MNSGSRTMAAGRILSVTDETVESLLAVPRAVVVTEAGNANGGRYLAEIDAYLEQGAFAGVTIGVLDRTTAEGGRFWRENPWLAGLRPVPYTLVYVVGQRVDGFAAVRADVLLARLAALETGGGPRPVDLAVVESEQDWWSVPLGSHRPAA